VGLVWCKYEVVGGGWPGWNRAECLMATRREAERNLELVSPQR
jgi:hypothetical protein